MLLEVTLSENIHMYR